MSSQASILVPDISLDQSAKKIVISTKPGFTFATPKILRMISQQLQHLSCHLKNPPLLSLLPYCITLLIMLIYKISNVRFLNNGKSTTPKFASRATGDTWAEVNLNAIASCITVQVRSFCNCDVIDRWSNSVLGN